MCLEGIVTQYGLAGSNLTAGLVMFKFHIKTWAPIQCFYFSAVLWGCCKLEMSRQ